jgi:hypothetical protein
MLFLMRLCKESDGVWRITREFLSVREPPIRMTISRKRLSLD